MTRRPAVTTLCAAVLLGCGGSSTTPAAQAPAPATAQGTAPAPVRRNANVISMDEIAALAGRAETALEIVEQLRPQMLRPRGQNSAQANALSTYVDGVRVGDVQGLRTVQANMIREIRYLSPTDATQRYGTGHSSGAIEVSTKR